MAPQLRTNGGFVPLTTRQALSTFLVQDRTGVARVRGVCSVFAPPSATCTFAADDPRLTALLPGVPIRGPIRIIESAVAEGAMVRVVGVGRWRSEPVASPEVAPDGYRSSPRLLVVEGEEGMPVDILKDG